MDATRWSQIVQRLKELDTTDQMQLTECLAKLQYPESEILKMRFGLLGTQVHDLGQCGKALGCNRVRIRAIESRAIKNIAEMLFPASDDDSQS